MKDLIIYDDFEDPNAPELSPELRQRLIEATQRAIDSGRVTCAYVPPCPTSLSTVTLTYLKSKSVPTQDEVNKSVDSLISVCGDRPVAGYTRRMAERYRDQLPGTRIKGDEPLGQFTVWNRLRNLNGLFKWATVTGLITENPFAGLVPPSPESPEDWVYLSLEDAGRLVAACDGHWGVYVALARYAGLRRNEIERARIDDVQADKTLRIRARDGVRTTKQGNRTVPIRGRLWAMIEAARAECEASEHKLLAFSGGDVYYAVKGAYARAGLTPSPQMLHSLRKSCISDWIAAGVSLADVAKWAGHSIETAVKSYHRTLTPTMKKVTDEY